MESREKMHILTGAMILITLGVLIALSKMNVYSFDKSWPLLLIVIAIGTLIQQWKDLGGWIIGATGLIFLLKENLDVAIHDLATYLLPLLLILIGINIIIRQKDKKTQGQKTVE
jgi:predicted membrane protein